MRLIEVILEECRRCGTNVIKCSGAPGEFKEGVKPAENTLLVCAAADITESLIKSGCTTVVFDENCNMNLPFGVDLITGGFEEMDSDFLYKLWAHKNGIPLVISEGERIVVKELCEKYLDEVIEISREEHVLRFCSDGRQSIQEQRDKLRSYIKNVYKFYDFGIWGIFLKESSELIGAVSLDLLGSTGEAEYELGFFIREKFLRQGLGTEAVNTVCEYAFKTCGISKITGIADEENEASRKLFKKCGFEEKISNGKAIMWRYC